jgi:tetratricopeptide (TPR) repeat protein/CHAT domain-containing protein
MKSRMFLACAALLVASVLSAAHNKQVEVRTLTQAETSERELRAGETHTYKVNLKAGDFMHAVVEQRGIDVAVTLIGPDGKRLLEADSPVSTQEAEWITYVTVASGLYKIEVRSVDKGAPAGRYEIKVEEQRKFVSGDEARLSAQRLFAEAKNLYDEGKADSYRKAIGEYEEALVLYRQAGRRREEAVTLNCAARAYTFITDYKAALEHYNKALSIYQEMRDAHGEGVTLNGIGYVHHVMNRYDEAIRYYEEALEARRRVGYRAGEGKTLTNLSLAYGSLNRYDKAVVYDGQALEIWHELKDRAGEASTLDRMGFGYYKENQNEKAVRCYEQSLGIRRELKDRAGEASSFEDLGFIYWITKEYEKAIGWYEQALLIHRELKDRKGEARTLDRLGFAYRKTNRNERAVRCYERALIIHRELKDRKGEASTLDDLAFTYRMSKEYEKAISWHEQALMIRRELKDRAGEASTLDSLALTYWIANDYEKAIGRYKEALAIYLELKDRAGEASTLDHLGSNYYSTSKYEKAISYHEQALAIRHELKDRVGEASTLNNLGDANDKLKQHEQAIRYYEQARAIRQELKDRAGEAGTLDNLGKANDNLKQYEKAIGYHEQALAIRREMKDPAGEATALSFLGDRYYDLKQFGRAFGYYEQALAIRRELKDRAGEARSLNSLGRVYQDLNEYEKAISFHEQALVIAREVKDRGVEAYALSSIGRASEGLNHHEKAVGYNEQALVIRRELKDREGEGKDLNALGLIQIKLSRYDKALSYFEQALAIAREAKDRSAEGAALTTLGLAYEMLSQSEKSLGYFEQALEIAREVKHRPGEAAALYTLGLAYQQRSAPAKAIGCFEQALAIEREDKVREGEGSALYALGYVYDALNQKEKAIAYYEQALAIAREVKSRSSEFPPLFGLGGAYLNSGQYVKATGYLEQALAIASEIKNREAEAAVLALFMDIFARLQQPRLAIILGKNSINIIQGIRTELRNLDQTLQQGFIQKGKPVYRYLADLLAGQGRLAEAQQVLDLLKQNEFSKFVVRDHNVSASEGRVTLTLQESEWEKRYSEVADRLTTVGTKRRALLAKVDRNAAEEKELVTLEADLEVGNRAFQAFLSSVETTAGGSKSAGDQGARVREAEGLMETLRDLGPGTVAVYTIVGEQGYRSILITSDVQKGYLYAIPAAELNKKILAFREVVRNPSSDPLPLARELYDILVKPMEKDLEGAQAQTIMWSLDGALRYMPVNALYDGERYLVERFRNVVFTPASQSRLKDPASRNWRGLGLGVSLGHEGFQPLPNVPNELNAIIQSGTSATRGILPGTVKLDGDFTKDGFRAELRKRYTIVHVASHFDFAPGTDRNSFLLMGDGSKLTLEEFRSMPQVLQGVELLTLSACDTAVGGEDADGKEVEGFAVLAQRQGAKAVIATLWAVADESTALLMKEFYRLHSSDPNITKAEALRQAQMTLLTGKIRGDASADRGPRSNRDAGARFVKDAQRPYAHPYFWAPFLLMGNWK